MCGISGVELMVILVIAIVVLGPDRLPEMMRMLGRAMREVRKVTSELSGVRDEFTKSVREELRTPTESAARRQAVGGEGQDVAEIDALRAKKAEAAKLAAEAASSEAAPLDGGGDGESVGAGAAAAAANVAPADQQPLAPAYEDPAYREMMDDLDKLPLQVRPMGRAIATKMSELAAERAAAQKPAAPAAPAAPASDDEGGAQ